MKNRFLAVILLSVTTLPYWGCKDDSPINPPNTTTLKTATAFDMEAPLQDGWLYYSFDTEAIVPASQAKTDQWDIKFRAVDFDPTKPDTDRSKYASLIDIFLRKGFFFLNSGNVNPNGKTVGVIIDSAFTQVTTAPDETKFTVEDSTYFANPSKSIVSQSFLTYSGSPNHTVAQNASRTLILRTRSGTYVKMQLLSIYKNHPATPTTQDDVGYYSIAFVKGEGKRLK
jgi:hypothetical protein